jgi:hypothetical protein
MDTIQVTIGDARKLRDIFNLTLLIIAALLITLGYTYYYANSQDYATMSGCQKTCQRQQYSFPDCVDKCFAYYTLPEYQDLGAFNPKPPQ